MFRPNDQHKQSELFNSLNSMKSGIVKKLLNSWAPVFYDHIFCKIDESIFSVLYCLDNGRPNFPVNILLSLEYIKHLFDYTDEEIMEQFYFNYQINYALGIRTLGEMNLAPRTIYEFRERIYQYTLAHPREDDLIFEQFIKLTENFIKVADIDTDEQRMDSSFISSNIKKAGRLSLAYDVLEQAVKTLPKEYLSEPLKKLLENGYKNQILFRTKINETTSKLEMLINLCSEVLTIVENIPEIVDKKEIKILERFISEQSTYDSDKLCYTPKKHDDISSSSLQSAYDEDATYRKKGNKKDSGYIMNITETCNKKNPLQVITDYKIDKNIKSDVSMIQERMPLIQKNIDCKELYTDGGYYSEEVVKKAKENEINIHYTDMTGRSSNSNKLSTTEFKIDETSNLIIACPKGVKPIRSAFKKNVFSAHFALDTCSNCELRDVCRIKFQKKSCVVRFEEKTLIADQTRASIKIELKENTSQRAAIEGTNSALKRGHGADNIKVRSLCKSKVVMGFKFTAHNFKKFARYITSQVEKIPSHSDYRIAMP